VPLQEDSLQHISLRPRRSEPDPRDGLSQTNNAIATAFNVRNDDKEEMERQGGAAVPCVLSPCSPFDDGRPWAGLLVHRRGPGDGSCFGCAFIYFPSKSLCSTHSLLSYFLFCIPTEATASSARLGNANFVPPPHTHVSTWTNQSLGPMTHVTTRQMHTHVLYAIVEVNAFYTYLQSIRARSTMRPITRSPPFLFRLRSSTPHDKTFTQGFDRRRDKAAGRFEVPQMLSHDDS
jgi:hypothetical protein